MRYVRTYQAYKPEYFFLKINFDSCLYSWIWDDIIQKRTYVQIKNLFTIDRILQIYYQARQTDIKRYERIYSYIN